MAEIFLLSAVCIILVADLFISDQHRFVTYWATQISLVMTAMISAAGLGAVPINRVTAVGAP